MWDRAPPWRGTCWRRSKRPNPARGRSRAARSPRAGAIRTATSICSGRCRTGRSRTASSPPSWQRRWRGYARWSRCASIPISGAPPDAASPSSASPACRSSGGWISTSWRARSGATRGTTATIPPRATRPTGRGPSALANAVAAVKAHLRRDDGEARRLLVRAYERIGLTVPGRPLPQLILHLVEEAQRMDPAVAGFAGRIARLVGEAF